MKAPDRVLLVGIDRYLPSEEAAVPDYPCLAGAVRDARAMERFLIGSLGVPEQRIDRLLIPRHGPLPNAQHLPTYESLVAALRRLSEVARPGEQVLFFYAGHGGRVLTAYPEIKGEGSFDEALVPWNIGHPEARYLRDVELAFWVHEMVRRGVWVTVILDCCHSGSALRDTPPHAAIREAGKVDRGRRSADSDVAHPAALVATWRALYEAGFDPSVGWIPSPRGYVLLAACEEHEKAVEYAFDGEHKEGAFTHCLLAGLAAGGRPTYGEIRDRVLADIRSLFPGQSPQIEGQDDRIVFETLRAPRRPGIPVVRVDPRGSRVLIHAGAAQGLVPGVRLRLETKPAKAGRDPPEPVDAVVTSVGATLSWARLGGDRAAAASGPGTRFQLSTLPRPVAVRLGDFGTATVRLQRLLAARGQGLLTASGSGPPADFQVLPGDDGRIEIRNTSGEPLANPGPALWSDQANWDERLLERLEHLARYHSLRSIPAPPSTSFLSQRLRLRIERGSRDGDRWEIIEPSPTAPAILSSPGERLRFELHNTSLQSLYLTFLDLRPDWSVVQIYPPPSLGRASLPLGPGSSLRKVYTQQLPEGSEPGAEEIHIFATARVADFRWLLLPPIDCRHSLSETVIPTPSVPLRSLKPEASADSGWTMKRIRLRVDQENIFRRINEQRPGSRVESVETRRDSKALSTGGE